MRIELLEQAYDVLMNTAGGHQAAADEIRRIITELREPAVIRVLVENGLIETVTGIPEGYRVRIIDLDTEGSDEGDASELSMDDRPAADDDERGNGPKPVLAFVTDHLPDGSIERPYEQ